MRRATLAGAGGGAHSIADAAVCPACRHSLRLHNAVGCVRAECECDLDRNGQAQPDEPPGPPSATEVDALDPPCARCTHRRGRHAVLGTGLPCRDCNCPSFATEALHAPVPTPGPAPAMAAAPAGPPTDREAGPDPAPAGATARAGFGLKAPRRPEPRPATDGALDVAAVGGDDADEEVAAAVPVATGAAVTSDEQAAAVPRAAAALDEIAALVQQVLTHAFMFSIRWYCRSCVDWPLDPGACRVCKAPLQPVYLATLPREIPA